jgi:hypothetical protein
MRREPQHRHRTIISTSITNIAIIITSQLSRRPPKLHGNDASAMSSWWQAAIAPAIRYFPAFFFMPGRRSAYHFPPCIYPVAQRVIRFPWKTQT